MNWFWEHTRASLCTVQGVALLLFFALMFVVPSGYSYGAALLLLCGIVALFLPNREKLSVASRRWIGVVACFSVVMVALRVFLGSPVKEYDELSRYPLSLLFLFGFTRYRPPLESYVAGLFAGTVAALLVVAKSRIEAPGVIGDFGHQHHILFSGLSMVMAVAAGFLLLGVRRFGLCWFLALLALCFGIVSAALGGGRGSWIMLPPVLLLFLFAARKRLGKKNLLAGTAGLTAFLATLYAIPATGVGERVQAVITDIQAYKEGRIATSQGMRLEMWQCSLYLIGERPFAGWGDPGLSNEKKRLTETGSCDKSIAVFAHLHNDYLDTAARYGLIGLAALLLLYFAPLWFYLGRLQRTGATPEQCMFAYSGIAITLCFMVASLTDAFLGHNIAAISYSLFQTWLISGLTVSAKTRGNDG